MKRQAIILVPNQTNWYPTGVSSAVFTFTLYIGATKPSSPPQSTCYVDSLYDGNCFRIKNANGIQFKTAASNIYNGASYTKADIHVLVTDFTTTKLYIEYGSDVTDTVGLADLYNISSSLVKGYNYATIPNTSTIIWALSYPDTHLQVKFHTIYVNFYTNDTSMFIDSIPQVFGRPISYTNGKDVLSVCELKSGSCISCFKQHSRTSPMDTIYGTITIPVTGNIVNPERILIIYISTVANGGINKAFGYYHTLDVIPVIQEYRSYRVTTVTNNFSTISPNGTIKLPAGSDITFDILPTSGATLKWVKLDDVEVTLTSGRYYTINDINSDHVIESYAELNPSTLYVDFEGNPRSGNVPLTVQFTDKTNGSPTQWSWEFQGGNPSYSTTQNPTVIYPNAGTYTVRLTARNSSGAGETVKPNYIVVHPSDYCEITAEITADVYSGTAPLTVNFTGTYTGNPDTFLWSFGDDTEAYTQKATHIYTTPGRYTVQLTASKSGCTSGSDSVRIIVNKTILPSFVMQRDYTIIGDPITFTNTTPDPEGSYTWTISDGSTSTDKNYTWTPIASGIFTVSLRYNSISITQTVHVISCDFTHATNDNIVTFTNESVKHNLSTFSWSFGDNSYSDSSDKTVKHTYSGYQAFTVILTHICGKYVLTKTKIINFITNDNIDFNWTPRFVAQFYPIQFNNLSEVEE